MTNGGIQQDAKYIVAKGETQLLSYLNKGYKLVQELNGDKYLLQKR